MEKCAFRDQMCGLNALGSCAEVGAMIVSTTSSLENRRIKVYLGVVTGESIRGINLFRDFFARVRDVVGGRSRSYEKELRKAREEAFEQMIQSARELGADAILGIHWETEVVGEKQSALIVCVSGTAVSLEDR